MPCYVLGWTAGASACSGCSAGHFANESGGLLLSVLSRYSMYRLLACVRGIIQASGPG